MRNPRPPPQPRAPPPQPPPHNKPPPSTPPTASTSAASKPPPPAARTATPPKPHPQSRKAKSRWDSSPSTAAAPSPQSNRSNSSDPNAKAKGGAPPPAAAAAASPSAATIHRDHTAPAAAAAAAVLNPNSPFQTRERAAIALPPPPPPYGFQNLDRRTIVLVDGSVRTYFALPPDDPLPDPLLPPAPFPPRSNPFSPDRLREPPFGKRKYNGEAEDELTRQRMHVLQYGNPNSDPNLLPINERDNNPRGSKHARIREYGYDDDVLLHGSRNSQPNDVDKVAIRKAFLKLVKMIYEDSNLKKRLLDTRKNGPPLHCIACGRASKDYPDVHSLITHSYTFSSSSPDLRADHLGFHRALCILMGWNYGVTPENNKAYQRLSLEEAQANREDLILWPPCVIIHNTNFGKRAGGARIEGFGNKEMDNILRDLGFPGGRARSIYNREGHTGVTFIQFANTESGLTEAERLVNYFATRNHDRNGWARARITRSNGDDDRNPMLVKMDGRTGEKKRIFYGYMATVCDIDVVGMDDMKCASVKSRREFDLND